MDVQAFERALSALVEKHGLLLTRPIEVSLDGPAKSMLFPLNGSRLCNRIQSQAFELNFTIRLEGSSEPKLVFCESNSTWF